MQTPVPKPTPAGEAPVPRDLFDALEELAMTRKIVIDRPKGSRHPIYPDIEYPLDYGYIEGTSAPDGEGIDVFVGSAPGASLSAIAITLDEKKRDVEPKLLVACLPAEIEAVKALLTAMYLPSILVSRAAS